jgi:hypothetical protein
MEWRRVHRPLRGAKVIAVATTLAIMTAIALMYAFLFGVGDTAFTVAMYTAIGAILLGMWAWRRWSYGVFVSPYGIRITYVSNTMLFALSDVAEVAVRRSTRANPAGRAASSLWIVTTDGTAVESPVVRGKARAGQYAIDRPPRLHLPEPVFDAVVADLRAALRRHR